MSKFGSAPAFIVWAFALLAILTPPEIAAASLASLLDVQKQVFELLVEEPIEVAEVAPKPPAHA